MAQISKIAFAFVDLEKAFDRILREKWVIKNIGCDPVLAVNELCNSAIRIKNTVDNRFNDKAGVHQGSVLNPLIL